MTEKSWPWSTVAGLGDGAVELGESDSRLFLATRFLVQDPTVEGVCKGVLGELAVSGVATPLTVQAGSAVCYGLYISDASETLAVTTPAVGTTGGRVVLQTNWAGTGGAGLEARTRLAVKMSADGNPAIPALTQSVGTTWEISLATFTVTTGGDIVVTDNRTFRRSTGVVGAAEVDNNSIGNAELRDSAAVSVIGRAANSAGDPADIAAAANDRVLRRVSNALDFGQLTAGMVPNLLITEAMLAAAAAAKLVTNGNSHDHNGGDGAVVPEAGLAAAVQAQLVTGGDSHDHAGGDGAQVPTAGIADNAVDDTKAGNRVPMFPRRQGGNATNWSTAGTTTYTPTTVKMQGGVVNWDTTGPQSSMSIAITFPVAFGATPIIIPFIQFSGWDVVLPVYYFITSITANGFTVGWNAFSGDIDANGVIYWLAIGPE